MHRVLVFSICFTFVLNDGVVIDASSGSKELQPYRTGFHFQPLKNWMNDPNGPMYYNGVYHLFYQYNPYGPLWGNISWGHSISYDLVNWFHLQPALNPKEPYDINGCISGSTSIWNNRPVILYTGVDLNNSQVQNLAFPENLADPLLQNWTKFSGNPLLTPVNDINPTQYRDPSTAWMGPDGIWRVVIGSEIDHHGTALLYYSTDGFKWTRAKKPLHLSTKTGMWECPDFFPVRNGGKNGLDTSVQGSNIKHVLKVSYNSHEYYIIGDYDIKTDQFVVVESDFGNSNTQLRYDYGRFYASKSFYDGAKKRRVLWAWVNEGDSEEDAVKKGWSGLQSFPRSIWLSDSGKQLVQWPVEEIEKLRTREVKTKNKKLKGGSLVEVSSITASQADVEVSFNLSNLNEAEVINSDMVDNPELLCAQKNASVSGNFGPFGMLVLASKNLTERTAVFFRVFKGPKKFLVLMCSDQSRSSIAEEVDKSIYGAFVDLDPSKEKISLRCLVDHSIVESFGGEGKTCFTARVYPKLAINEQAQLYVFNNGKQSVAISSLSAWSMNKARIVPLGEE